MFDMHDTTKCSKKTIIICGIIVLAIISIFILAFYIGSNFDKKNKDNKPQKESSKSSQISDEESNIVVSDDKEVSIDMDDIENNVSSGKETSEKKEFNDSSNATVSENKKENTIPEKTTKIFPFKCEFSELEFKKEEFYDVKNGNTLPYRLFVPQDYDSSKQYPVVLFLHGAGEIGSDNETQLKNIKNMFQYNNDLVSKAIILCPQSYEWWNLDRQYSGDQKGTLGSVLHLLEEIKQQYSCDDNRIYVTGLSMGGYATWELIEEYGDIFAAAIPVCGGGNPGKAYDLKDIPIRIYHSVDDPTVSVSASQRMYDAIVNAGGQNISFIKLNGYGHNSWDYAYSDRDTFCWLFAQNRTTKYMDEYSYLPYFRVVDYTGKTVISDEDVASLEYNNVYYIGSQGEEYVFSVDFDLYSNGTEKLTKAYLESNKKEFTVYWLTEKIYTFTAESPPSNQKFSIVNVFNYDSVLTFYKTIRRSIEILNR